MVMSGAIGGYAGTRQPGLRGVGVDNLIISVILTTTM